MIIHGGEPPFIEQPEPRWGGVIKRLNDFTFSLQQRTQDYNQNTQATIAEFSSTLTQFIVDVVVPIDAHYNAEGLVHGEHKGTIGLELKDNYPTATLEQQTNLIPVDAYVTPQGVKAAFENMSGGLGGVDGYQMNDGLNLGLFYYPDEYPTLKPTVVDPVRFFGKAVTTPGSGTATPEVWKCNISGNTTTNKGVLVNHNGDKYIPNVITNSFIRISLVNEGDTRGEFIAGCTACNQAAEFFDTPSQTDDPEETEGPAAALRLQNSHYTYTPAYVPPTPIPESWTCRNSGAKTSSYYYPRWSGTKVPVFLQRLTSSGPYVVCTACNQRWRDETAGSGMGTISAKHYIYTAPNNVPPPEPVTTITSATGVLLNGDRVVFSPMSDDARHQREVLYLSGPLSVKGITGLSEIPNLETRYSNRSWNSLGCATTNGKVALFKPLADKSITECKNQLSMVGSNLTALLFSAYADFIYKGLAVTTQVTGGQLTIAHKFFHMINLETDPTLVDVVNAQYSALFTQINRAPYSGAANGSHTYNFTDLITLQAGQTVELDTKAGGVVTSLFWNVQDVECYLHVVVPLLIRGSGGTGLFNLEFIESIKPGKLVAGGSATFTLLGSYVKDVVAVDLTVSDTARWIRKSFPFEINNPGMNPGIITPEGELIKAAINTNALRLKRTLLETKGIKAWATSPKPSISQNSVTKEVYPPSRYSPLGNLTERIIPVPTPDSTGTEFLVYAVDNSLGKHQWSVLGWGTASPVINESNGVFGLSLPAYEAPAKVKTILPPSLGIKGGVLNKSVELNGLAFTSRNNFKGYQSVEYRDGDLVTGGDVDLDSGSLSTLKGLSSGVITRAKVANPKIESFSMSPEIHVFAFNATLALVLITDGVAYGEVAFVNYTLTNGIFKPSVSSSLALKRVTATGLDAEGLTRTSGTGDGVWLSFSDCFMTQLSSSSWGFVISRPFGDLYGDIAFQTATPVVGTTPTPVTPNVARLYSGRYQFDLVDELFPPVMIPGKGLYRHNPANARYNTRLLGVGLGGGFDPYAPNGTGWVSIPAGSKVVLAGKAITLSKAYPVKVLASGTSYCYLVREGANLVAVSSPTLREVSNNEVLFGVSVNGILDINHSYLVLDKHVISPTRKGSAVAVIDDNGGIGVSKFFTQRDLI